MIDLSRSRFHDLLPPNLQNENTEAFSYAIDRQHRDFVEYVPKVIILADVMSLDEKLCDFLALVMDLAAYDFAFDLDTKRRLIAIAMKSSSKRGTAAAVQDVLTAIHGGAEVSEWFQYGGDPYYFKVNVDTESIGITEQDYERFIENINAYKSVRSHLEGITVTMISKSAITLGGAAVAGELTVMVQEMPDAEPSRSGIAARAAPLAGEVVVQHPEVSGGGQSSGAAVPVAAPLAGEVVVQHPEVSGGGQGSGAAVPAAAPLAGEVVVQHPETMDRSSLVANGVPVVVIVAGEVVTHHPAIPPRLRSIAGARVGAAMVTGDHIIQMTKEAI